ncbi:hypothetical protein [Flavobacterium luminosum]|uniref:Quinol oxidase subunit 4 n=1 Tax=Flavobacterium luminosum TaxID=2949086 RepID=A0ABT0TL93_9FLAO|nr:hypothetical protein [Flavobacterium sp. HXWNR70]MCL9808256.1 hypothetical protein [Flavobacterium sp. HXWNR70]
MKSILTGRVRYIMTFFLLAMCLNSCVHVHSSKRTHVSKHKRLPPGHAKKVTGDKSAKKHAPGHRK